MPVTYAISQPTQGPNGRVVHRVRLVVVDVPDDATEREVLDWLDDHDDSLDSATPEHGWSAHEQLTAPDAPRVKWRGRPGRPEIGPPITVRLQPGLLAELDTNATRADQPRAEAIRRLLQSALHAPPRSPLEGARDHDRALANVATIRAAVIFDADAADSYWLARGSEVLAALLHAAAISNRPIQAVLDWTNRHDHLPIETVAPGSRAYATLGDLHTGSERERDGALGTASRLLNDYLRLVEQAEEGREDGATQYLRGRSDALRGAGGIANARLPAR